MYYRIDAGPLCVGTTVDIPGPTEGSELHSIEFWSVDKARNSELPKTATFTVWSADSIAPVTTSDALAAYMGPATITLSPTDAGGSGILATYYRVDSGVQKTGTVITVQPPSSGIANHTIEFWSVDYSGNVELHKTKSFVMQAATGTIKFAWDSPAPGSIAEVWVRNSAGIIVYHEDTSKWNPPGWFTAQVPVSTKPYQLEAWFWDEASESEGRTFSSALIDAPGKTVTWWY